MGLFYESFDERFFDVVDVKQDLATVCSGFTFIEGPIWNDVTGCLTFNDIPESRTYRLEQGKTVRLLREDTHKANGNAYDMDSNIIVCEHVRSCISRTNDQGENLEVLVSHYGDKELNSPNDVVVRSDGVIFLRTPDLEGIRPGWDLRGPRNWISRVCSPLTRGQGSLSCWQMILKIPTACAFPRMKPSSMSMTRRKAHP